VFVHRYVGVLYASTQTCHHNSCRVHLQRRQPDKTIPIYSSKRWWAFFSSFKELQLRPQHWLTPLRPRMWSPIRWSSQFLLASVSLNSSRDNGENGLFRSSAPTNIPGCWPHPTVLEWHGLPHLVGEPPPTGGASLADVHFILSSAPIPYNITTIVRAVGLNDHCVDINRARTAMHDLKQTILTHTDTASSPLPRIPKTTHIFPHIWPRAPISSTKRLGRFLRRLDDSSPSPLISTYTNGS